MTTWDTIADSIVNLSRNAVTDGENIFFADQNGHVYQYEPGVGVSTIYTGESGEFPHLQMFKGYLYMAIASNSGDKISVQKYVSGVWGEVWSDDGYLGVDPISFMGDDDALVLAFSDFDSGTFTLYPDMVYSSDGTTWSQSITWDAGGMTRTDYSLKSPVISNYVTSFASTQEEPNIFAQFSTASGSDSYIYKFASGQWQRQSATDWGTMRLLAVNQDAWWRDNSGTYEYSYSDWESWTAPANNYKPMQGINIDRSFASNFAGGGGYSSFYYWDTGTNAWVLDADYYVGNAAAYQIVRLNNDDVFALVSLGGDTSREFYQRDPGIAGGVYERGQVPAGAMEFWRDTNGPGAAKKSDLPFNGIDNPDCMALDEQGNVYVVSDTAGDTMCVKATPGDDYATWEDLTPGLGTSTGIKAIEAID
jgi:hypothetical protein